MALVAAVVWLGNVTAVAQNTDAAGDPALTAPTVLVTDFIYVGNSLFSSEELDALHADLVGKELDVAEILSAADRVNEYYREHGYLFVTAYLPGQEIDDGIVRIEIVEGYFGEFDVENESALRGDVVDAILRPLEPGQPIMSLDMERATLLLDDLRGVDTSVTFAEGDFLGSVDTLVTVEHAKRLFGSLSVSNRGGGAAPYPVAGNLAWENVSGRGDRVALNMSLAGSAAQSGGLTYSLPIGGDGAAVG